MRTEFRGSALTFEEQVALLRSQGLIVEDEQRAVHILQNISYSRLKSYFVPLMSDRDTHAFKPGSTFEQAYIWYGFDRRLRELVFHELEKVEISVRARIAYASAGSEGGYWFTNPDYFRKPSSHQRLLRRIYSELERSDNDAIQSFRRKYTNEFPPCWLTLEATSMGTLSTIYDEMRPGLMKRGIAAYYGLTDTVFASWLHHFVYIRNTCAHHSRLWNKTFNIRGKLPEAPMRHFPEFRDDDTAHIYFTLCAIKYMVDTVKPTNTFSERLQHLLDCFPRVDQSKMGFPRGWENDRIWKK